MTRSSHYYIGRNIKLLLYAGVSKFLLKKSLNYHKSDVNVFAYNILLPDAWSTKRKSYNIINIGNDGLRCKIYYYIANRYKIDYKSLLDTFDNIMIVDGVDIL